MTRRQIIHGAKLLVLAHGPSNVLGFGNEYLPLPFGEDDRKAIDAEAMKQARGVSDFLG